MHRFSFSYIALAVLFLVCLSSSLQAQSRHGGQRDDRVYFDNRTSSMLSIYKAPISSRSRPVKNLESGDVCALPSQADEQWVVTTPVWYRLVSSIRTSERGPNRLVIRDSELRAIGGAVVNTTFVNRSGSNVKVKIIVDGIELDWLWIKHSQSSRTLSFPRQNWVVRDQDTGKLLQRATTPSKSSTIAIGPGHSAERGGSQRDRGDRHDRDHSVELTITNRSTHMIAVYRKTTFGSRKVGSIASGRSVKIDTNPGEVWRIENTVTMQVLKTIVVPDDDPHCSIDITSSRRPAPVKRKVKINFHNETNAIIYIYKEKELSWKYTKRIYPDRNYTLEFDLGQAISIRDPKSGKELERLKAPSRDTTMHIEPHADHAHADSGSGSHRDQANQSRDSKPEPEAEEKPESLRPRDILRRLLRGD